MALYSVPLIFPLRYSSLMVYKLPVEDVRPLAQAFFKLEKGKKYDFEIRPWKEDNFEL